MLTLTDIINEGEEGSLFSHLPESLDSSKLADLIEIELPEEIVINNIKYNPTAAKLLIANVTPKLLQTFYFIALGYNNERVGIKRDILEGAVENDINKVYSSAMIPADMNQRVSLARMYRLAFPHLFPNQQYNPIQLKYTHYRVAQMIAEGHTNDFISKRMSYNKKTIEKYINIIFNEVRKQFPAGYILRVQVANMFNSGAFSSESYNPSGNK